MRAGDVVKPVRKPCWENQDIQKGKFCELKDIAHASLTVSVSRKAYFTNYTSVFYDRNRNQNESNSRGTKETTGHDLLHLDKDIDY